MPRTKLVRSMIVIVAALGLVSCGPASESPTPNAQATQATPQSVGDCVQTKVASVGPRLEGAPDSGSSVAYENGLAQVSYDVVPGITNSQQGDDVRLCLVSLPENCPPGDDRGRVYDATNLRTNETWAAPDSQHMCGGA